MPLLQPWWCGHTRALLRQQQRANAAAMSPRLHGKEEEEEGGRFAASPCAYDARTGGRRRARSWRVVARSRGHHVHDTTPVVSALFLKHSSGAARNGYERKCSSSPALELNPSSAHAGVTRRSKYASHLMPRCSRSARRGGRARAIPSGLGTIHPRPHFLSRAPAHRTAFRCRTRPLTSHRLAAWTERARRPCRCAGPIAAGGGSGVLSVVGAVRRGRPFRRERGVVPRKRSSHHAPGWLPSDLDAEGDTGKGRSIGHAGGRCSRAHASRRPSI